MFILSSRGDILVNSDLRQDISKNSTEVFFTTLKLKEQVKPIFNIEGVNYIYLERANTYIVATSWFNICPSLIFEYLNKMYNVFTDFLGEYSEKMIRKNFVLVYEIINEMMDFGYP